MIVVCDSTVLIALARIKKLDILQKLLKEVYIPDAVYKEVVIDGKGMPGSEEIEKARWIKKTSIKNIFAVKILEKDLGEGESEAIILAQELSADYVVLDEEARKNAELLNLKVIGTLGILSLAFKRGLMPNFKEILDKLIDSGFHIKDELYRKVLRDLES